MSDKNGNGDEKKELDSGHTSGDPKQVDRKGKGVMSTSPGQEEELKTKYGGLRPKLPLIQTSPRSYFDSADWEKSKKGGAGAAGSIELLPPKLQPSAPHKPPGESPLATESSDDSPTEKEDTGDTSLDDPTGPNPSQ